MFEFSANYKKNIKINIMLNARIKDIFDDYHLNKIDCDFPALVESLNL